MQEKKQSGGERIVRRREAVRRAARPLSLAIAACFGAGIAGMAGTAQANPVNPTVTNGAAQFTSTGNLLTITNSPNTIINWGSFSIGASEITRFVQQSASSLVLNRVLGQNPSAILGALQSNGRVMLINPNGIVFGAGSQINVAGLTASTLNITDADFLAGRFKFADGLGNAVINNGSITAGGGGGGGGSVYLVGSAVTNNGIITSPNGEVVLAAGNSVELVNPGTPDLRVQISAPDNQAVNLGSIVADSGRVGIYAGLITHGGSINADSVTVGENGQITLQATQNTTLQAGSTLTANGPTGGSITVQSGDTTEVYGTIEAKGSAGQGGTVQVLGNLVGLTDATVDASGTTGGGTVLIGGDMHGANAAVQNAFRSYVGQDVTIKADATQTGDGGKVVVWADDVTRYYGNISAKGGAQSGNGGSVEVSGHDYLDFRGGVNAAAAKGAPGTLLLDPSDITIVGGSTAESGITGSPTFTGTANTSNLRASTIVDLLNGGTAVTVDASAGGGAATGIINVNADIIYNSAAGLTLKNYVGFTPSGTGPDINVNNLITNGGSGFISLNADGAAQIKADVSTGGTIFVDSANVYGIRTVSGITSNNGIVQFLQDSGGNSNVNVMGDVLADTINVTNAKVKVTGGLTVAGTNTLRVTGPTSSLDVTGGIETLNAVIDGGTLTVGGAFNAHDSLTLTNNGVINGAGNIDLDGVNPFGGPNPATPTLNWSSGTIGGAGTLTTETPVTVSITGAATLNRDFTAHNTVALGSGTAITGSGNITFDGPAFNWSAGSIGGTGTLTTTGTATSITGNVALGRNWTMNGDGTISGASVVTLNSGGNWTVSGSRTLHLQSTTQNQITGAGTLTANTSSTVASDGTGAAQISSTFNNNGKVSIGQALTVSGDGTDTGTYQLDATGNLTFASGNRAINGGTITRSSGNVIGVVFSGGTVTLDGATDYNGSIGFTTVSGGTVNFNKAVTVQNSGLTVSAGTANFNNGFTGGGGNITISGSGTANFSGTTGITLGTLGISAGTLNFGGATTVGGTAFNVSGGTVTGNGAVTVNVPFTWSGGTITTAGTGTLTTSAGVTSTISGAATLGRNWSLLGPGILGTNGTIVINSGSTWTIGDTTGLPITLALQSTRLGNQIDGLGTMLVNTKGIVSVEAGTTINAKQFINDGTVNVGVGGANSLTVSGDFPTTVTETGTYNLAGTTAAYDLTFFNGTRSFVGATLTAPVSSKGSVKFTSGAITMDAATTYNDTNMVGTTVGLGTSSQVTFNDNVTFNNPLTVTTNASVSGSGNLTVANALNWAAGTIGGTGTLTTSGTVNLAGNTNVTINRPWIWSGATGTNFQYDSGTTIGGAGSFSDQGKITVAGDLTLNVGGTDTNGTYTVNSGKTLSLGGGTRQFSTTTVADGGGGTLAFSGATVNGTGTVGITTLDWTGGTFDNSNIPLTVSGATTVNVGNTPITLNNTANDFNTITLGNTGAGNSAKVIDANAISVGTSNVGGSLAVQALAGNSITLTGNQTVGAGQTYQSPVILGAAVTLASTGGGNIAFNSTVDGAPALTVNTAGTTTFAGVVGGTTKLTSLTTDAAGTTAINTANITTTGAQTYGDAVTLGADSTLASTGLGNISFNGTLNGGQALIVNTGGTTTFGGVVGSGTNLTSITTDAGGTTAINTTSVSTTGVQVYGDAAVLGSDTVINGNGVFFKAALDGAHTLTVNDGGTTRFSGAVGGTTPLSSITTGTTGATAISTTAIKTSGSQSYGNAVQLNSDSTLSGTNISFSKTVNGTQALTVNASGTTTFGGAVGGTTPLTNLATDAVGSTAINGAAVTTSGTQTYGDAVTLGADTTLDSTGGSSISFNSTVNGTQALTVNTRGATTFGGVVGGTTKLASLTTDAAGTTAINSAGITTAAGQSYGDAVTLGANTTLTSTSNGNIVFSATLDGAQTLAANTGGTTTFGGLVGGTTKLASLATDAGGTTVINTNGISTAGAQSYGDAVTLGSDTLLRSTGSGNISFGSTVDGAQALTLSTAGTTTFSGVVGGTTTLVSFKTDNLGTTAINTTGITTTDFQNYGNAVALGAAATLTSTGSGAISFASTVDGTQALTVNTAGTTTFGGVVGGTTKLASLATDAAGTTAINTTGITTAAGQSYGDAVTLAANTTLTGGGNIAFGSTIDGAQTLAVNTPNITTFGGVVGGTTKLTSLATDTTGTTAINTTAITTTGLQSYGDAVTLGANATLISTGGGNISFATIVNGAQALTVNTAGATTFNSTVGGSTHLTSLTTDAGGTLVLNGVSTTGAQSYGETTAVSLAGIFDTGNTPFVINAPVTLTNSTTVNAGNGAITFNGTLNGTQALIVNSQAAATTFNGVVGGTAKLASLTTDAGGTTVINAAGITTTGAQSYGDAVTLGANTTLASTGSGNIGFNATVDGAQTLAVNTAGATSFGGVVGGTTKLTSLTTDNGGTLVLNGVSTTGTQSYGETAAVSLAGAFSTNNNPFVINAPATLTGGTTVNAGNGAITFNGALDGSQILIANSQAATTFNGVVGGTAKLTSLTTDAGGTTVINTTGITTSGAQGYGDAVTLGANAVLASSGSGSIGFGSMVDGAQTLTVNTAGVTTFAGAVGSTTKLTSLTTDATGTTAINTAAITTTGLQSYGDAVTLGADATLGSTGAGNISFANTVNGAQALTVNTGGTTAFGGVVGGTAKLTSVTTDATGTTAINTAGITTTGLQSYGDAVTLGADTTLGSTGAGNISFANTINGAQTLTVNTTGATTFGGTVGGTTKLTSLTTNAGGTTTINATTITTTGLQSYGDAVTLGADTTLGSTGAGDISFNKTVNGAQALTVNTGGTTTFGGVVGGTTKLTSVTTDATGATAINTTNITTSGAQSYGDAVTLGADTTLGSTGAGNISFANTVNGAQALTVNTLGTTTFGGAVGGITRLTSLATNAGGTTAINATGITTTGAQSYGDAVTLGADTALGSTGAGNISFANTVNGTQALTVNTGGATTFDGVVGGTTKLTSVTTDATGTTAINTTGIITTGLQSYGDAVTLGTDTTLGSTGAGNISFANTVDGAQALTVNTIGTTTFGGAVGGITRLTSLTTNAGGTTAINATGITTTGLQSYGDAVTLGADTALGSTGAGNISFASTVNGAQALTVNTGGTTTFAGVVGGTTKLTSLTTDAAGTTAINTTGITTSGVQSYGDAVTLGADTTLASTGSGNISFNNTVNGAQALTVNTAGVTTFGGVVGGSNPLTAFTTDAAGSTVINGGSIFASGPITLNDAVSGSGVTLAAGTAAVTATNSANDFSGTLTLQAGSTQVTDSNSLTVALNTTGAATLKAGGDLGISGTAASLATTTTGVGNTTFGTAGTNVTGSLNINSAGGVIETGPLTVGGTTDVTGGSITLTNPGNQFNGTVSLSDPNSTNVSIAASGAIALGTVTLNTGSLHITAGGALTQSSPITALGDVTLTTGTNPITLTNPGNDFGGMVNIASAGTTQITDQNTLSFLSINSGPLTLISNGALTLNSGTVNGALSATATGITGNIIQLGTFTVTGTTDLNAGGIVSLGSVGNDFQGPVSVVSKGIALIGDKNALTVVPTSTGSLTVNSNGALTFGAGTVNGTLDATSNGGNITQSGALTVTGTSNVNAGAGTIALTQANNDFQGAVSLTSTNAVAITDRNALTLGTVTLGTGTFDVTAGGAISQSGEITQAASAGTATFNAGANAINLANAGNDFTGQVVLNNSGANDISIADANGIRLAAQTVGGALTVGAATGNINIAGNIASGGAQTYNGSVVMGTTATLSTANSDVAFNGTVTLGPTSGLTVANGSGSTSFKDVIDGNNSLSVTGTGATTFTKGVGGGTALTSLAVSGLTNVNGGAITTSGNQGYSGGIAVNSAAALLTTSGGAVTVGGASTLGQNLTIGSGTGNVTLSGTMDGPGALVVNSGGITAISAALGGTTRLASLTTDAAGTVNLASGAAVHTTGDIILSDAVTGSGFTLDSLSGTVSAVNTGNNLTGNFTVDAVNATLSNPGALDVTLNTTGTTVLGAGTTITARGAFSNITSAGSTGGGAISLHSTAPVLTVQTVATSGGNVDIGADSGNLAIAGVISSTGLTTAAAGTQTLSGVIRVANYTIGAGGGGLTLQSGASVLVAGTLTNAGTLDLGGQTLSAGTFSNTGMLKGNGTIKAVSGTVIVNNTGTVSPGNSPGLINILGDFTTTGTLNIDVAGASPSQFDRITVSGNTTLGGTLNVFQLGGFIPAPGDGYQFITTQGTSSGSFSSVTVPPAFAGMAVAYGTRFTDLLLPFASTLSTQVANTSSDVLTTAVNQSDEKKKAEAEAEEARSLQIAARQSASTCQ